MGDSLSTEELQRWAVEAEADRERTSPMQVVAQHDYCERVAALVDEVETLRQQNADLRALLAAFSDTGVTP